MQLLTMNLQYTLFSTVLKKSQTIDNPASKIDELLLKYEIGKIRVRLFQALVV